jgi:hypothetical protein
MATVWPCAKVPATLEIDGMPGEVDVVPPEFVDVAPVEPLEVEDVVALEVGSGVEVDAEVVVVLVDSVDVAEVAASVVPSVVVVVSVPAALRPPSSLHFMPAGHTSPYCLTPLLSRQT